jgi:hypothetical protein
MFTSSSRSLSLPSLSSALSHNHRYQLLQLSACRLASSSIHLLGSIIPLFASVRAISQHPHTYTHTSATPLQKMHVALKSLYTVMRMWSHSCISLSLFLSHTHTLVLIKT